MGVTQEQAAAAIHAAKMAQISALGPNFDKRFMPPHVDLSKINNLNTHSPDLSRIHSTGGVTIEPTKVPTSFANTLNDRNVADIRRDDPQPMDLGMDNQTNEMRSNRRNSDGGNHGNSNNNINDNAGGNSSGEDEYGSDDDGDREHNS